MTDGLEIGPDNGVGRPNVPALRIFEDPPPETWTVYAETYFAGNSPITGVWAETTFNSTWAYAETTTVTNEAWGVVGGYKVKILIFGGNIDNHALWFDPIIIPPACTPSCGPNALGRNAWHRISAAIRTHQLLSSLPGLPHRSAGANISSTLSYGPATQVQADMSQPVIEKFLAGELSPS